MSRAWRGGSTRAWRKLRAAVLAAAGYRCQVDVGGRPCGLLATHADHVVPRSQGGLDVPSNLRASCAHHNLSRGAGPTTRPDRQDRPRPVRTWSW